jgi:two-component system phosphate regulon response regulator OmpR
MTVPLLAATAARPPTQPADDAPHILLVDDDRRIRDLICSSST